MRTLFSDRWFLGGMVWFAALIVGLQVYGGAYRAEFTGHADEAAHFVSALLVRDYLGLSPLPAPMPWAAQYYLHYPLVAIGQWPPGYYIAQALWWLVFPVSRATALWLNIGMALSGMTVFYVLARRIRPGWPVIATGTLLLCTRVVQEANATVMADLPSLVAALIVLWTLTRLAEEPDGWRLAGVAAALGVALFVKGTGVALLVAPVLLAAAGGWWRRLPLGRIALIAAGAGLP
ncbi:MAG: glycosyltransferase family 39 protein, partial [Saprospiraceae bacterium]